MNPFNTPSQAREDEELVSPMGTRYRNYNALLNNSLMSNSTDQAGADTPNGGPSSQTLDTALHTFTTNRQLVYNGYVLGKRRFNPRYNLPREPKRRCRYSPTDIPEVIPFSTPLPPTPKWPKHVTPQNIDEDLFSSNSAHSLYHADPFLSQLPLTSDIFNAFIRPPETFSGEWARQIGYGNDWPPGTWEFINPENVHPLLKTFIGCRSTCHYTGNTYWPTHDDYPELWRPLLLATHFLSNTHSLAFFHRILFQEPQLLEPESRFYGRPIYHLPTDTPIDTAGLNESQRIRTIETLAALRPHIQIDFSYSRGDFPLSPSSTTPYKWARTSRSKSTLSRPSPAQLSSSQPPIQPISDPSAAYLSRLNFRGTNARITLDPVFKRFLEADSSGTDSDGEYDDDDGRFATPPFYERQYAMFFMAIVLVREIARAAWLCRFPSLDGAVDDVETEEDAEYQEAEVEPFVGNMRRADLGKAWERSVFGGTVEVLAEDLLRERRARQEKTQDFEYDGSGDLFAMGLGLKVWPDREEKLVTSRYYEGAVPLARVLDAGEMMDFEEGAVGVEPVIKVNEGKLNRLPVVQSADRWEYLSVMPFWFVAQFFQEEAWNWAHGPASTGGEKSTFRQWVEMEAEKWPLAVKENPHWVLYNGRGARPADFDEELEMIQRDLDMESDCTDGPGV